LNFLFDQIFQTHIYNLLTGSFDLASSDLFFNSQIYLNLLLLVNNISDYYKEISSKEMNSETLQVINLIKFNVQKLYSRIFALIDSELDVQVASSKHSQFQLIRVLRFLNDALFFRFDGYYSPEFYYIKGNTNYGNNALKLLRANITAEASNSSSKRVLFNTDDTDEDGNTVPQVDSNSDWWTSRQRESIFYFSLQNGKYSERIKRSSISLLEKYPSLFDNMNSIVVKLIRLLDCRIAQASKGKSHEEEMFLIVYHIQYILR